jgi:cold shock CspA family protein
VTEFDDGRGLGVVLADDGRRFAFHCAAIADGTRSVAVGARVVFCVVPGHGGRYEARAVTTMPTA